MRNEWGEAVGCGLAALGFIVMALPYGWNEFTIASYASAAALAVAGTLTAIDAIRLSRFRAVSYAAAALGCLDIVRIVGASAWLEIGVFLLIALGLLSAATNALRPGWIRHGTLLAALGALAYPVHDLVVGYTQQLPADILLVLGFVTLWIWTIRHHIPTRT